MLEACEGVCFLMLVFRREGIERFEVEDFEVEFVQVFSLNDSAMSVKEEVYVHSNKRTENFLCGVVLYPLLSRAVMMKKMMAGLFVDLSVDLLRDLSLSFCL